MKVVFRKFKDGQIIALFCGTGKDCTPGNVMSYMHHGQHGEACRHLGRDLPPASPDEYAQLCREIESIYKTKVTPVSRLVY